MTLVVGSGAVGTAGGRARKAHPGNCPGSLAGETYSPWMAAKNHQLAGSSSALAIMARTPVAYQCKSVLPNVPPDFHALLRVYVAMVHLVTSPPAWSLGAV